jgi:PKD repeat protein
MALSACIQEEPAGPGTPLIPPQPPNNPEILSASWRMDVDRPRRQVVIKAPTRGLDRPSLQILADYFGVEAGSPDLSILAGDVVEIMFTPGTFASSAVGAFAPGQVRTTFEVAVRNRLTAVNITTPTFPAPPAGTTGVILFPFEVVVTETPGGVTVGGDGTDVLVELPNRGLAAPSTNFDNAPFNFFNDVGCGPTSTDCYRSETFLSTTGTPTILGGATSQSREIGFDHDPTVSQFRARLILAGDLLDATPNTLPTAEANGPYSGTVGTPTALSSAGSTDPDGTIAAFAWDLDNDGGYDDATGASPSFTCSAAGSFTIGLRVTDNRGGTGTDTATITCTVPANTPPTALISPDPASGTIGGPAVALSGAGSTDAGGAITAYAWDLDNDGAFDDATGVSASFTCTTAGAFTVGLQVTDNGTPALTGTDTGTVNCAAPAAATIRGRWVDAGGAAVTSTTVGATVFLEVDVQLGAGSNIHDFQGTVLYSATLLAQPTPGADLNCSGTGGQATCPSGSTTGNVADVMNQYVGSNTIAGQAGFLNTSVALDPAAGTGIQGLARLQFTASATGTVTPTLSIVIAVDGAGADLNPVISLPSLTVAADE